MNENFEQIEYQYPPKGKIITSMIMGICSVSMGWYPFIFSIPCIVFGIVALALSKQCAGAPEKFNPMLKAARITGIIGLILSIISTIFWIVFIVLVANEASGSYYYY